MTVLSSKQRAEAVAKAMRLAWSSLDRHLDPAIKNGDTQPDTVGNADFHKQCVREYVELIQEIAKLY